MGIIISSMGGGAVVATLLIAIGAFYAQEATLRILCWILLALPVAFNLYELTWQERKEPIWFGLAVQGVIVACVAVSTIKPYQTPTRSMDVEDDQDAQ